MDKVALYFVFLPVSVIPPLPHAYLHLIASVIGRRSGLRVEAINQSNALCGSLDRHCVQVVSWSSSCYLVCLHIHKECVMCDIESKFCVTYVLNWCHPLSVDISLNVMSSYTPNCNSWYCRLCFRIISLTIARCIRLMCHFVNYTCILWYLSVYLVFSVVLYLVHKVDFEHYSILNTETSNDTRNETDYKNYAFLCVTNVFRFIF